MAWLHTASSRGRRNQENAFADDKLGTFLHLSGIAGRCMPSIALHSLRRPTDLVQLIGIALIVLGTTVTLGWLLHIPSLVQILPGYVAMVLNTALCFVCCGVALLTSSRSLQRTLAGAVMILACVVWAQDIFAVDLRIDNEQFSAWLSDPNPHRGRMAPQTAICFLLSGCALLLLSNPLRRWSTALSQMLVLSIGATGIVSLVGYSLKLELLYDWYRYTRMAVHTAAAFTLLACALWIMWYRRSALANNFREREDRRFNAIVAALIVFVTMSAGTAGFALLARHTETIARNVLTIQLEAQREAIATMLSDQDHYAQLVARLPRLQRIPSTPADDARLMNLNDWSRSILGDHFAAIVIRSTEGESWGHAGTPWDTPILTIPIGSHVWLLWNDGVRIRRETTIVETGTSRALGFIVTEMDAPIIAQLSARMATMAPTAEMRLCSLFDRQHMQCLPTRLEPKFAQVSPRFIDNQELPMSRTFRGESGTAIFTNYRNHRSIGAYGPLGNTGLGIVVQQDVDDTYAPIRKPFQLLLLYLALLVSGTILLLRWQVAPLVRKAMTAQADSIANAARVAAVMNSVPDGIITIDMQGTIISVNPAVTLLFGYQTAELIGKNVQMLMPASLHARHGEGLARHRETGQKRLIGKGAVEVPARRSDGREFTMQLALTEMHLADHRYVVGIMRDVTERIVAERKLNNTYALLQTTLDNVIDAIVTTKQDGVIQAWNLGAERIFGYTADEALHHDLREVISPTDRSALDAYMRDASSSSAPIARRELDCLSKSGRPFPIELGTTIMTIDGENLLVHVIRDISERREVDRVKNEFVSAVSHELRTPLTSIAGSLGLLAGGAAGELPPQARKLVAIANQNSARLDRLINDILDLEKSTQGKLAFDLQRQSLWPVLKQVIEANQPYAMKFNVHLQLEPNEHDVLVAIDAVRLGQVLTNVISNAIKFSPRNETVTVRFEASQSSVRIAVQDRGPGIPDEFRAKIFQRFAQADGSDTRAKGGTGLGLSIAKSLIKKMQGDITYDSSSQGTTFYVSLPLAPRVGIDETAA